MEPRPLLLMILLRLGYSRLTNKRIISHSERLS
jgi:hypothetical protein